jgi:flagellar protein FlaG
MSNSISWPMPPADAGIPSRLVEVPLQPVRVTAIGKMQGNATPETGADAGEKLQQRLAEVAARMNEHMQQMQRRLRFNVDEASGHIVVKVIDTETNEVIRQIPSEEMLAMMKHINEFDGLILNDRA